MAQGMDFCDLTTALRSYFFPKDRDISLPVNRNIYINTGGTIYGPGTVPISIPLGNIVLMFSGAVVDIPVGWQLADGTNGTTDLRNRFVVGAGDTYSPGDTGGADTVDISHIHANDTMAAANESAHTHASGSLATDSDQHNHSSGSLSTDTEANHTHTISSQVGHQHAAGTFATTTASSDDHQDIVDLSGPNTSERAHTHTLVGDSGHGGVHAHGGATVAGGTHSHDVDSGSTANDTHSHDVDSGNTAAGSAHGHTISGNTATGGDTTHDNRPQFYALCLIMRPT